MKIVFHTGKVVPREMMWLYRVSSNVALKRLRIPGRGGGSRAPRVEYPAILTAALGRDDFLVNNVQITWQNPDLPFAVSRLLA